MRGASRWIRTNPHTATAACFALSAVLGIAAWGTDFGCDACQTGAGEKIAIVGAGFWAATAAMLAIRWWLDCAWRMILMGVCAHAGLIGVASLLGVPPCGLCVAAAAAAVVGMGSFALWTRREAIVDRTAGAEKGQAVKTPMSWGFALSGLAVGACLAVGVEPPRQGDPAADGIGGVKVFERSECEACQKFRPQLEDLKQRLGAPVVIHVDVDTLMGSDEARQSGVRWLPTTLLLSGRGELLYRKDGYAEAQDIEKEFRDEQKRREKPPLAARP
jgi:thiol-disulfide isomerase/thioredoxin